MVLHRPTTIACVLLVAMSVSAQCFVDPIIPNIDPGDFGEPLDLNIQTDFGAVPGEDCNNHYVFQAAAQFFTDHGGPGTLKIPAGVYIVGRQKAPPVSGEPWLNTNGFVAHQDVMVFSGCSNLVVYGDQNPDGTPASILRFEDCMLYGRFDTEAEELTAYVPDDGETSCAAGATNPPNAQVADIGAMIRVQGCRGVRITDLELDGNVTNQLLGGGVSCADDGIQRAYDGIILGLQDFPGSVNSAVRMWNLNIHHFGRDGMIILRGGEEDMGLVAQNCHFDFNERTGVAWVSGRGVDFQDCSFNYNSTGRIRSAMGVGLDIEHEFGSTCGNGRFLRCEFLHNRNTGMITNKKSISSDVSFSECVFKSARASYNFPNWNSPSSSPVWPTGPFLRFNYCAFFGPIYTGYDNKLILPECSASNARSTQFNFCKFYEEDGVFSYFDWTPPEVAGLNFTQPTLVHMPAGSGTQFWGCRFESNCRSRFLQLSGRLPGSGCPSCSNNVGFTDCTFLSHGVWGQQALPTRCMFTGNNISFVNSSVSWPSRVRWQDGQLMNSFLYNYSMNLVSDGGAFNPLDPICSNWNAATNPQTGADDDASALAYFAAHPCLPLFENPNTQKEVQFSAAQGPLLIPVDGSLCGRAKGRTIPNTAHPVELLVADGQLLFQAEGTQIGAAQVLDATGKVVAMQRVVQGMNTVDLNGLGNGMYFLRLDGTAGLQRFMVVR